MIAKLKAECGYQFTTKLEGMFVDMNISKTVMEQFRQSVPRTAVGSGSGCELEVTMLSTSNWPLSPVPECRLPPQLTSLCKQFCDFYADKHSGRRLVWMTNHGYCDLKVLHGRYYSLSSILVIYYHCYCTELLEICLLRL